MALTAAVRALPVASVAACAEMRQLYNISEQPPCVTFDVPTL